MNEIDELEKRIERMERQHEKDTDEIAELTSDLQQAETALAECRETLEQVLGQIENTLRNTR